LHGEIDKGQRYDLSLLLLQRSLWAQYVFHDTNSGFYEMEALLQVANNCMKAGLPMLTKRTRYLLISIMLLGLVVGIAIATCGSTAGLFAIGFVSFLFLIKYPEVFLTLFVFAGIFKSYPSLTLPFNLDWTATMGISALFFMVLRAALVKERMRIALTRTDFFIAGLVLVLGFGLMYSQDRMYGIERVLELLFLGVLASYFFPRIMASFSSSIKIVRNILLTIVALAGITTLLSLFNTGTGYRAFAGSYLSWSYFLGVAILSGLALLDTSSNKLLRFSIIALEPLFLVSMILAKARGPLISLFAVGVLIFFWRGRLSIRKKIGIALSFLAVFALLFVILPRGFWFRYELLFAEQKGSSIEARLEAYKLAEELFIKNPLVGAGTGSFKPLFASAEFPYSLKYAHNAFLEIAAENGLLGLFFYVGFLISLFLLARRILRNPNTSKIIKESTYACLLVLVFLFVGSQFSGVVIGRNELFFAGLLVLMGLEAKRTVIRGDGS
jgi:O-antigen ligase